MAWKADSTANVVQMATYGVTSVDGTPVTADVQAFAPVTVAGGAATSVGPTSPLPTYAHTGADYFDENGNNLTVQRAFANVATGSTDANVVTAIASKAIRVINFIVMVGATAQPVTFNTKPAGAGTAISMTYPCAANGGVAPGREDAGWFQTNTGEGLTVSLPGGGGGANITVIFVAV